ncbi:MAG: ROK family glucokinase [Oscillospiraceae bacterium]|nr:ROK family glucokinase [Oscillospiraceae bacterium]
MLRIGIDLGGTKLAAGVIDENYALLSRAEKPTRAAMGAETVIADMAECVRMALAEAGKSIADCAGAGIGSPGLCDTAKGSVRNAHNLGWYGVPVCDMLSKELGVPVKVDNDANCAALGEVVAGAAKGSKSALMVTLGTGVGGGIIIGGEIYSGWQSLGGEIGHMCIVMDGEQCSCGEKGCWEAYAASSALVRQAEKAAAEHPESLLAADAGSLDGKKIFAAVHAGDSVAMAVVERYCAYVGVGIVNLVNAIYPESIIIGGGISAVGETILSPIREYIGEHFFASKKELMPRVAQAQLGNDAGIIGAAALIKL